jgi:hypothetical protein
MNRKPVVHVKDVVQEMDVLGDEHRVFLNICTGEFVLLTDSELMAAEDDDPLENIPVWQYEMVQKAKAVLFTDDYRELPSKFEIHEYAIMEKFCYTVEDDELHERLLNGIRGRGAFRYFKDVINQYGIEEDWYDYREQAFKEIAINWLESNGVAYTDDKTPNR